MTAPSWASWCVDIAYGGNFYAIVEPQPNYPGLDEFSAGADPAPVAAAAPGGERGGRGRPPRGPDHPRRQPHPVDGKAARPTAHARNAVFYGDKAIDRSPCGTGTSARMAQLAARGKLKPGDEFVHESIIGSQFEGRVEAATEIGGQPAIVPSIAGWARMTGLTRSSSTSATRTGGDFR